MTGPPTLSNLMADPGELDVSCLDCHHNTTMPVAALLPRYAAETPFPEAWGGFRCSAWGSAGRRSAPLGGPPNGGTDNSVIAARTDCVPNWNRRDGPAGGVRILRDHSR
jgi:hypothetical protein